MEKGKVKKILAGACLGLVGVGCLTGCDMSTEDMSKWESKADVLIETLEKTNENTNDLLETLNKIDKQEAYDILINATMNMKLLNFGTTQYLYETRRFYPNEFDEDSKNGDSLRCDRAIVIPTGKSWILKSNIWDSEQGKFIDDIWIMTKIDFNDRSMSYKCGVDTPDPDVGFDGGEFAYVPTTDKYDELKKEYLSLSGWNIEYLRDYNIDNLVSYSLDENGVYTFNLIVSWYNYYHYTRHYTIKVKDGLFQSIDSIDFEAQNPTFVLDENGNKIPDKFGGYEIKQEHIIEKISSTIYKYGNDIDASELEFINNTVAEYDIKAQNNEISEGSRGE